MLRRSLSRLLFRVAAAAACALAPSAQGNQRLTFFELPGYCAKLASPRVPYTPEFLQTITLPPEATFVQIHAAWKALKKAVWVDEFLADPVIDARRLINEDDWAAAVREQPNHPWAKYGPQTIKNHYAVTIFVRMNAGGQPVDASLLQTIHRIAMSDLPFHGFEGRRLLLRRKNGEITPEKFKALLGLAYDKNHEIAGVAHDSLRGKFRWDSIDEIEHRGSSFDAAKGRYFTAEELAAHRQNPYLHVDEASIRPRPEGGFTGVVRYHPVAKVKKAVNREIDRKMRKITELYDSRAPFIELVGQVVELEKNLMSIHPFLDGNGRTIRALSDLIYYRLGLPPPLRPNENDLVFPTPAAVEYTRREMIATLAGWVKRLRGAEPGDL